MRHYFLLLSAVLLSLVSLIALDRKSDEPPTYNPKVDTPRTFARYDCTVDCSGHEAGYRWAELHDINDEDDCDTAALHSNSSSFGEGCKAYVNGELLADNSGGDMDQDSDDEQ